MFVTLFNLQGARRSLAAGVYFTISFLACQALFSSFLKLFQPLSQEETFRLTPRPPLRTTCLYYQLSLALSSAFLNLFGTDFSLDKLEASGALACRKRFAIIADFSFLVNHFFPFFPSFFQSFLEQQYLLFFPVFYTQDVVPAGKNLVPSIAGI